MNIEKYQGDKNVINSCRFCFMCRHLSTAGIASGRESDNPRVRALIAGRILNDPEAIKNPDFAKAVFAADLSAAPRMNCVTHYDEVGLTLALRRDFIAAGNIPAEVAAVRDEAVKAKYAVSGKGDTLFLASGYAPADKAMAKLLGACRTMKGAEAFATLALLGFDKEAKAAFAKFKAAAAGAKTIVTDSASIVLATREFFKGVKVLHTVEFLAGLKRKAAKKAVKVEYIQSDLLRNYLESDAACKFFKQSGAAVALYGTNEETSYTVGEISDALDRIDPVLVGEMAEYCARFAPADKKTVVVAASPVTVKRLAAAGVKALTFGEFAAC